MPAVRKSTDSPTKTFSWIPTANMFIWGATLASTPSTAFSSNMEQNMGSTMRKPMMT